MHKGAHSIWPPGSRSLPTGALKTCHLVPESLTDALEIAAWSAEQEAISRAPVQLSGHQLAGFQCTSWQDYGPRGPNTMSTFMHVAGQGEGLGRQPRCP